MSTIYRGNYGGDNHVNKCEIERLTRERDAAQSASLGLLSEKIQLTDQLAKARKERDEAEARAKKLEELLDPFIKWNDQL